MPDLPEKLEKLNLALRKLSVADSLETLVERILNVLDDVFGQETAALLLLEPDGQHLRIAGSRGYDPRVVAEYRGVVGEGVAGSVARTGKPRLIHDVAKEQGYIRGVQDARSEMVVPLLDEDRVMGVLDLESRTSVFVEEDVALLTAFGELAAWALRHQEALSASRDRAKRLELLHRAAKALNAIHDPEQLLERILTLAHEALGFDSVAILLPEGPGRPLVVRKVLGREGILGLRIQPGQGIAGSVFTNGKGERIGDVTRDARYIPGGTRGDRSEMAVPLALDGEVIGVLDAESRQPDAFKELDLEVFSAFAAQVATALRNAEQLEKIERQAHRLRLIMRAGKILNTRRDLDEVIQEILKASDEALGLGRVALLLLDHTAGELVVHSAVGYGNVVGDRIPLGKGVTGWVAVTGEAELVKNVQSDDHYVPGVQGGATEMAVPLRVYGELIGVLDTESTDPDAFDKHDLELFKAFADQVSVAIHNARLFKKLEDSNAALQTNVEEMGRLNLDLEAYTDQIADANASLENQVRQLTVLHEAGQAITSSLDLRETLDAILKMTSGIVKSSAGAIKLLDEETKELRVKAQAGRIHEATGSIQKLDLPLRIGEKTIGVFELIREASGEMDETERKMLETLASQASIAIENARLFEDTQRNYYDTLKSLARVLEAKDEYTRGHSERVAELSLTTAQAMGASEEECQIIFNSALLHDIGKIGVRDSVLLKSLPLSPDELEIIRKHPTHSHVILGPLKFLGKVSEFVKHHHEAWDGSGYPLGLKGEEIPFASRVIAVADAYDAMTSTRPYRDARSHEQAMAEIQRQSGKQFDPLIAEAFGRVMAIGRLFSPE